MRIVMFVFAAIAAAFGLFALANSASDIQIGIAANAIFSAVVMFGVGTVLGRTEK